MNLLWLKRSGVATLLLLICASAPASPAAPPQAVEKGAEARSEAYYHFTLGHLYQQLAMQFARKEYADRAIEEYKLAIEQDPQSSFIRMKLIGLYASTGQMDEALAQAEDLLARDPDNAEVHKLLGRVYRSNASDRRTGVDTAMIEKAVEQYERALDAAPRDLETLLELASLYRFSGKLDEAKELLERALEVDPGSADALSTLASLRLGSGDVEGGIELLEKAVAADGDLRQIGALAEAYQTAGRYKEAADLFAQLLAEAEENEANALQIRQMLAQSLRLSGQIDAAREQYETLAEAEPQEAEHRLRLAQIAGEQRRFPDAWENLKAAAQLDPENLEVKYNTVMLLEAERRIDEAIEALQAVLAETEQKSYEEREARNRIMFLEHLASLYRQQERFDEAAATYQRISELDESAEPRVRSLIVENERAARRYEEALKLSAEALKKFADNRALKLQRASLLAETGRVEEGAKILDKLITEEPESLDLYLQLAHVYEKGKQFDKGLAAIEKAYDLASDEGQRLGVLFTEGALLERAKRYEESERKFRELLEADPDNSGALNYLGYMLADRGVQLDEAHAMIQRALDLDPDNGAYLDSLGWLYYRQDKLELAERYLLRSLEQYSRDPVVHTHLGDVYYALGNKNDARKHWERGLEEWRNSPAAEQDSAEMGELRRKLEQIGAKVVSQAEQEEAAKPKKP